MNHLNKTVIREEIQWLLEAIAEQFEAISSYEDKIPQIEFDIILENVRKLYENLHNLNRTSEPFRTHGRTPKETPVMNPMEAAVTEVVSQETRDEKPAGQPAVKIRVDADPVGETFDMTKESRPGEDEMDLFSVPATGFSERLKEAHEISHGPEKKAVKEDDLKAMISINEKFLFINELFDGNLREYNLMIEALNNSPDLKYALDYIDLLRKKNLWESASPAFRRIMELVEHKF